MINYFVLMYRVTCQTDGFPSGTLVSSYANNTNENIGTTRRICVVVITCIIFIVKYIKFKRLTLNINNSNSDTWFVDV